jgi:two-component system chemotaxis response regulator CheB
VNHEPVQPGTIYVAPPDHHLHIEKGRVVISRGPRENRHRPAIDAMFRSVARAYGQRVIGVVLSGQLDDGSAGLMAIKMAGGLAIVQDPAEAICPEMPSRAIQYAGADRVLRVQEIAGLLADLASEQSGVQRKHLEASVPNGMDNEAREANLEEEAPKEKQGKPSAFACPECHGVMWEVEEGALLRFRCRVGHAYTADALRVAMSESVEDALWASMRAMEEKASILRRMGSRSSTWLGRQYEQEAAGFDQHVKAVHKMLLEQQALAEKEAKDNKEKIKMDDAA